jgi:hypothetical protein
MLCLKCMCCGFERDFLDAEDAFKKGWDAPPHFTGYVACNLCPASTLILEGPEGHAGVHRRWAESGRPDDFDVATCT